MAIQTSINEIVSKNEKNLLSKKKGWLRLEVKNFARVINGFAFKSSLFATDKKGMPIIRIRDIHNGQTKVNYLGDYEEQYIVNYGDILIGMDGDFKLSVWSGKKGLLNQRVCKIIIDESKYNKKFFCYVMPGYLEAIHKKTSSVTVKHLSSLTILDTPLPNPSLSEQNLIVQEIEKQFTRLDESIKSLKFIKKKLEVYRKAVLKRAFENLKEFHLLGNIIKTSSGGTPSRGNKSYYLGNIPWLKSGELMDKLSIEDSEEHISEDAIKDSSAKLFPKNTVLMAMYGATTGKIGILSEECSTNQAVCGMLPNENFISKFLFYYLMLKREYIIKQGKGGAQPNISQDVIKKINLPLCSKEEQTQIVQEIESKFSVIDKIEQVVNESLEKSEKLRKSILKNAFEGKLVKMEEVKNV